MVVTVKVAPKAVVTTCDGAHDHRHRDDHIRRAPHAHTISEMSVEERAKLAALPVTVAMFSSQQHISSQQIGAAISDKAIGAAENRAASRAGESIVCQVHSTL